MRIICARLPSAILAAAVCIEVALEFQLSILLVLAIFLRGGRIDLRILRLVELVEELPPILGGATRFLRWEGLSVDVHVTKSMGLLSFSRRRADNSIQLAVSEVGLLALSVQLDKFLRKTEARLRR